MNNNLSSTINKEFFNTCLRVIVSRNFCEITQIWNKNSLKPTNLIDCLKFATNLTDYEMVQFLLGLNLMSVPEESISKEPEEPAPKVPEEPTPKVSEESILKEPEETTPKVLELVKQELFVTGIKLKMNDMNDRVDGNSTFMVTMVGNPAKALKELNDGIISIEEINHQNNLGWTPMHYLAHHEETSFMKELVKKLLELGADVNLKTLKRNSVLVFAVQFNPYVAKILIEHPKTDLTSKNNSGASCLMMACKYGNKDLIKLLIPKTNIYAKNDDGESAIAFCKNEDITEISEMFWPQKSVN